MKAALRYRLSWVFAIAAVPISFFGFRTLAAGDGAVLVAFLLFLMAYMAALRFLFTCRVCGESYFTRGSDYIWLPWPKAHRHPNGGGTAHRDGDRG